MTRHAVASVAHHATTFYLEDFSLSPFHSTTMMRALHTHQLAAAMALLVRCFSVCIATSRALTWVCQDAVRFVCDWWSCKAQLWAVWYVLSITGSEAQSCSHSQAIKEADVKEIWAELEAEVVPVNLSDEILCNYSSIKDYETKQLTQIERILLNAIRHFTTTNEHKMNAVLHTDSDHSSVIQSSLDSVTLSSNGVLDPNGREEFVIFCPCGTIECAASCPSPPVLQGLSFAPSTPCRPWYVQWSFIMFASVLPLAILSPCETFAFCVPGRPMLPSEPTSVFTTAKYKTNPMTVYNNYC